MSSWREAPQTLHRESLSWASCRSTLVCYSFSSVTDVGSLCNWRFLGSCFESGPLGFCVRWSLGWQERPPRTVCSRMARTGWLGSPTASGPASVCPGVPAPLALPDAATLLSTLLASPLPWPSAQSCPRVPWEAGPSWAAVGGGRAGPWTLAGPSPKGSLALHKLVGCGTRCRGFGVSPGHVKGSLWHPKEQALAAQS